MTGVLVWVGVVLINMLVMLLLNHRRWRRRKAASMESALGAAVLSTGVVHAVGALADGPGTWLMWSPFTVVSVGAVSLVSSWGCLLVSERWSTRT